jgi:hypothetical protein
MFVANIVTKNNLNIDKYFNVVESIDDIIKELPTLVIGWDIVKTINPNADFIDKKLSKNIFWTFKKTERRDIFEEDLYDFIYYSYNLLVNNIEYKFVDTIQMTDNELKHVFKTIKEYKKSIAYKYGEMLYVYTQNNIYGIDLNLLKYMGLDYNKTINKIKSDSLVFLDNEEILIEYKDIIDMLNNEVKYVPYLYSIEHG